MRKHVLALLMGVFFLGAAFNSYAGNDPGLIATNPNPFAGAQVSVANGTALKVQDFVTLTLTNGTVVTFQVLTQGNSYNQVSFDAATYLNTLGITIMGNALPSLTSAQVLVEVSRATTAVPFDFGLTTILGAGAVAAAKRARNRRKQQVAA